jgi:hypothetical protein
VLELAAAAGAYGVRVAEAAWHWADPEHAVPPIVLGYRGVSEPAIRRDLDARRDDADARLTAADGRLYPGTGSALARRTWRRGSSGSRTRFSES